MKAVQKYVVGCVDFPFCLCLILYTEKSPLFLVIRVLWSLFLSRGTKIVAGLSNSVWRFIFSSMP